MTPEKHSPTPRGPFGFTIRDIVFLSLLVILLGIGLIPLVQSRPEPATPEVPSLTPEIVSESTPNQPDPNEKETPIPLLADEPTPTLPPTQEKPTETPTSEPPTPTMTPTTTPTVSPTPTATPAPLPTSTTTPTIQPTVTPTLSPTVTATSTPVITATSAPIVNPPTPVPQPATVIYVQSSGQAHRLGIITSSGNVINTSLVDYAAAPAWSPNGTKIAFFGEPDINKLGGIYTEGEGIWMIDVQSNNPTYLFKTNHVKNLAWSPDGAKLAFEYGPPDRFHEIIVINPANGQKINNFPGEQPAWSPDSQKLTIKACLPSCGLWQVNLDGSNGQQLTFHDSDSYPSWSRNGDLAFSSQQAGNSEIYLLRPGSEPPQRLTNRTGTDTTPVFSPDGLEIYLRTNAFGNWQITAITLDGGNERPIKEDVGPSDEWGLARPAVH